MKNIEVESLGTFENELKSGLGGLAKLWGVDPNTDPAIQDVKKAGQFILGAHDIKTAQMKGKAKFADIKPFYDNLASENYTPHIYGTELLATPHKKAQALEVLKAFASKIGKSVLQEQVNIKRIQDEGLALAQQEDAIAARISAEKIHASRTGLSPVDYATTPFESSNDLIKGSHATEIDMSEAEWQSIASAPMDLIIPTPRDEANLLEREQAEIKKRIVGYSSPAEFQAFLDNVLRPRHESVSAEYQKRREQFATEDDFRDSERPFVYFKESLDVFMEDAKLRADIEAEDLATPTPFPTLEDNIDTAPLRVENPYLDVQMTQASTEDTSDEAVSLLNTQKTMAQFAESASVADLPAFLKDTLRPQYAATFQQLKERRQNYATVAKFESSEAHLIAFQKALEQIGKDSTKRIDAFHSQNRRTETVSLAPVASVNDETVSLFKAEEDELRAHIEKTASVPELLGQLRNILQPRYVVVMKELQAQRNQNQADPAYNEAETPLGGFAKSLTVLMQEAQSKVGAIRRANPTPDPRDISPITPETKGTIVSYELTEIETKRAPYAPEAVNAVTPAESPLEFYKKLKAQFDEVRTNIRNLSAETDADQLKELKVTEAAIASVMVRTLREMTPADRAELIAENKKEKEVKETVEKQFADYLKKVPAFNAIMTASQTLRAQAVQAVAYLAGARSAQAVEGTAMIDQRLSPAAIASARNNAEDAEDKHARAAEQTADTQETRAVPPEPAQAQEVAKHKKTVWGKLRTAAAWVGATAIGVGIAVIGAGIKLDHIQEKNADKRAEMYASMNFNNAAANKAAVVTPEATIIVATHASAAAPAKALAPVEPPPVAAVKEIVPVVDNTPKIVAEPPVDVPRVAVSFAKKAERPAAQPKMVKADFKPAATSANETVTPTYADAIMAKPFDVATFNNLDVLKKACQQDGVAIKGGVCADFTP